MTITFVVPGKPFAWRRARSNGKVRFNDPAMEAHADTVKSIALQHFPAPLEGPVRLTVRAIFNVPQSWSKKRQAATIWRPHTSTPDSDNLAKQLGDALNRIAWMDDGQIAETHIYKMWGNRDETLVIIEPMVAG
jgi:Holliday junction resolvase RusA-like endonuclease